MSASATPIPAVTRFAPSPTGALHLGNARTALFSHMWARKTGGRFILRIEDTDVERNRSAFLDSLYADLRWLGLEWDEGPHIGGPSGPYLQAERTEVYGTLYRRLQDAGRAYPCYCTAEELELSRKLQRMAGQPPRYAGTCRSLSAAERAKRAEQGIKASLRFAVPADLHVDFVDTVHGAQRFSSNDIGDFIIRREDGTAAFFFCNAVDDSLMGVTHVLRGDDHLANTPRQLMLLDALDLRRPGYGHVALLVGSDGSPLSKRHGSSSVQEFRDRGVLPQAILNQLFRLGHASDLDGWIDPADMPAHFRPEHLGRAPARFDEAQLMHWQKESLARLTCSEVGAWLGAGDAPQFIELLRHNLVLPDDAVRWRAVLYGELPPRGAEERAVLREAGASFFAAATAAATRAPQDLGALVKEIKAATGRKGAQLYMPLRIALTGQAHGPELGPLLNLMPPELVRRRLGELARADLHAENP